jgi:hypothetical protein
MCMRGLTIQLIPDLHKSATQKYKDDMSCVYLRFLLAWSNTVISKLGGHISGFVAFPTYA